MSFKIDALDKLIEELGCLPGIGEKTAQRLAFHLLKDRHDLAGRLGDALKKIKETVRLCNRCFNYTDQDVCAICRDGLRDRNLICVVEEPAEIMRIESAISFKGLFHVLQGVISPLDGVGPDDLRIVELIKRIEEGRVEEGAMSEVVLALDADLEGDATSLYLTRILKPLGVRVTRLAQGVPIGGNLEYVDSRTLSRALENRVEL